LGKTKDIRLEKKPTPIVPKGSLLGDPTQPIVTTARSVKQNPKKQTEV